MTDYDLIGLATPTARIRYAGGAPDTAEWASYRPAPSVHRQTIRRLRRHVNARLRDREP